MTTVTDDDVLAAAVAAGIQHKRLSNAECRLAKLPIGTIQEALTTFGKTAALARAMFERGRESVQNGPAGSGDLVLSDAEIDAAMASIFSSVERQLQWVELVGRPSARAVIAALNRQRPKKRTE